MNLKCCVPMALLLLAAAPIFGDDWDKKTDVTISRPVQVPGTILQPGQYVFVLLNSDSDRHIVEIRSEDGKHLFATIFTAAARRVEPSDRVVLTFYEMPQGSPDAVREWFWPGEYDGQEFLYARSEAAEISRASHETVLVAPERKDGSANSTGDPAPARK